MSSPGTASGTRTTIPEVQWLVDYITFYVQDLFDKAVNDRKILPEVESVHWMTFELMYMEKYRDGDYVTHDLVRKLLQWVYENQAVATDPTPIITALKFISPNLDEFNLDDRTMAAVCQPLILTGAGVLPETPAPATLLPYEAGFDIKVNLVQGQFAYNSTDDIWYVRIGNVVTDLRDALNLEISHINGLQEALDAVTPIEYLTEDPIEIITAGDDKTIRLKFDAAVFELNEDGELTIKTELGTYLSTAVPEEFTSESLDEFKLLINHGLGTVDVKLHLFDYEGNFMDNVPWKVDDENNITVDFTAGIVEGEIYKYIVEYWKNQSIGIYPDPAYAVATHDHNGVYAEASHNHNGVYSPVGHSHSEYSPVAHNHAGVYATAGHNHAGVYQPAGTYAKLLFMGTCSSVGAVTKYAGTIPFISGSYALGEYLLSHSLNTLNYTCFIIRSEEAGIATMPKVTRRLNTMEINFTDSVGGNRNSPFDFIIFGI